MSDMMNPSRFDLKTAVKVHDPLAHQQLWKESINGLKRLDMSHLVPENKLYIKN